MNGSCSSANRVRSGAISHRLHSYGVKRTATGERKKGSLERVRKRGEQQKNEKKKGGGGKNREHVKKNRKKWERGETKKKKRKKMSKIVCQREERKGFKSLKNYKGTKMEL